MAASVTIEQLIGLNREIAALVRAGVPLEQGLRQAATGNRDAASQLALRLGRRMDAGASLGDALKDEGETLPRAYRAIVEAGQRSGHLPEALEAVAGLAESMQELKRRLRISAIYPCMVALLAYGLFVLFIVDIVPRFTEMTESMRLPAGTWLPFIASLGRSVGIWGPAIPIAFLLLLIGSFLLPAAGLGGLFGLDGLLLRWLPGISAIRNNLRRGWFCQLLSTLVRHQVPLPEALELAGDALGTGKLRESAQRLAAELRIGKPLAVSLSEAPELSPLVRWMMASGDAGSDLGTALQRGSVLMLARAGRQAELFQSLTPILAVVLIGGGAALTYALTVFGPLMELLDRLTVEPYL